MCVYVYTLRNKLWNEFKTVDLLSEQMKDFVILMRRMDEMCSQDGCLLILENYICTNLWLNCVPTTIGMIVETWIRGWIDLPRFDFIEIFNAKCNSIIRNESDIVCIVAILDFI